MPADGLDPSYGWRPASDARAGEPFSTCSDFLDRRGLPMHVDDGDRHRLPAARLRRCQLPVAHGIQHVASVRPSATFSRCREIGIDHFARTDAAVLAGDKPQRDAPLALGIAVNRHPVLQHDRRGYDTALSMRSGFCVRPGRFQVSSSDGHRVRMPLRREAPDVATPPGDRERRRSWRREPATTAACRRTSRPIRVRSDCSRSAGPGRARQTAPPPMRWRISVSRVNGRGTGSNRPADQRHIVDTGADTSRHERRCALNGHLLGSRQLAVDERLEQLTRRFASEDRDHDLSPSSSARSACRARVSRDLTVPTATPREKAISS